MSSQHAPQAPTSRLMLNDYLQQWRRQDRVRWVATSRGPRQRPHWTVTCYLSDIAYGTGYGLSKAQAKERAAQETLSIINRQHVAVWSIEYFKWATDNRPPPPPPVPMTNSTVLQPNQLVKRPPATRCSL